MEAVTAQQRRGVKPKLNFRTVEELHRQAKTRWDSLPDEQKKMWGNFAQYFNAALEAW